MNICCDCGTTDVPQIDVDDDDILLCETCGRDPNADLNDYYPIVAIHNYPIVAVTGE